MTEEIEVAEVEEVGTDLVHAPPGQVNLFRTEDPTEIVAKATNTANALAEVIRKQKLATRISGKDHVRVEGWTLLGSMLGVFAVCVETRKLDQPEGWLARVEARTLAGAVVGAAEAECLYTESKWENRDDYALLSMAQTRATSKALRQPLGFVMTLAGFSPTPAEEIPDEERASGRVRSGGGGGYDGSDVGTPQTQEQRDELVRMVDQITTDQPKAEGQESYWQDVERFAREEFAFPPGVTLEDDLRKGTNRTGLTGEELQEVIDKVKSWSIPL